ncbi:hypothetical protein VCHA51O444_10447 [Vibrio chagasii]|nr:hypothetical protein VCHA51O444_10447 [Vibrio chagasii]CAH7342412.1 hypothetical protein VCHA53O474_30256 [Vibrio chagasii]
MFDANAAGIDVGEYFFAEVHSANRRLKKLGAKDGSFILCQHQRKSDGRFGRGDHTKVWVSKESDGQDYFGSALSGGASQIGLHRKLEVNKFPNTQDSSLWQMELPTIKIWALMDVSTKNLKLRRIF